jgi:hypothetical protein
LTFTFDLQQQPIVAVDYAIKRIYMADGSDIEVTIFDADDDAPFSREKESLLYRRVDGAFVVFDCSQPNEFETRVRYGKTACNV